MAAYGGCDMSACMRSFVLMLFMVSMMAGMSGYYQFCKKASIGDSDRKYTPYGGGCVDDNAVKVDWYLSIYVIFAAVSIAGLGFHCAQQQTMQQLYAAVLMILLIAVSVLDFWTLSASVKYFDDRVDANSGDTADSIKNLGYYSAFYLIAIWLAKIYLVGTTAVDTMTKHDASGNNHGGY